RLADRTDSPDPRPARPSVDETVDPTVADPTPADPTPADPTPADPTVAGPTLAGRGQALQPPAAGLDRPRHRYPVALTAAASAAAVVFGVGLVLPRLVGPGDPPVPVDPDAATPVASAIAALGNAPVTDRPSTPAPSPTAEPSVPSRTAPVRTATTPAT